MQQISDKSHDDYGRRANGILSQLQRFDTFFGIKLSYLIFSATEQTSVNLQKKDTSVQEALACAEVAMNHMKRMRTDDSFRQFYGSTVEEAKEFTDDPELPRHRRPPRKLDEGERPHVFKAPEEMYRMHYFYAIDLILQEISDRFDQKSLQLPREIESLLLTACNNQDMARNVIPECIAETYRVDLDVRKLEIQLQMLPDLLQAFKKYRNLQNITVTKLSSFSEMLTVVPMARNMFSEVDKWRPAMEKCARNLILSQTLMT